MVRDDRWLSNVKRIPPKEILLGNGSVATASFAGNLTIRATSNHGNSRMGTVKFKNVLFVPDLHTNHISCSSLCDEGFEVAFRKKECKISQYGQIKLRGAERHGVFVLEAAAIDLKYALISHSA